MIGTVEIFDANTTQLVYSDGYARRAHALRADDIQPYIVIRRMGPKAIPCARLCMFILEEFQLWHLSNGQQPSDYFSYLTAEDKRFFINPSQM